MITHRITYIRPDGTEGWREVVAEDRQAAQDRFRWLDDGLAKIVDVETVRGR